MTTEVVLGDYNYTITYTKETVNNIDISAQIYDNKQSKWLGSCNYSNTGNNLHFSFDESNSAEVHVKNFKDIIKECETLVTPQNIVVTEENQEDKQK